MKTGLISFTKETFGAVSSAVAKANDRKTRPKATADFITKKRMNLVRSATTNCQEITFSTLTFECGREPGLEGGKAAKSMGESFPMVCELAGDLPTRGRESCNFGRTGSSGSSFYRNCQSALAITPEAGQDGFPPGRAAKRRQ